MRVVTRGDADGLVSTVLLTMVESIREIRFAHPKDVQDGKIQVDADDIIVNLPYVAGCGLWFDHHVSEERKLESQGEFKGSFKVAPSAARVIYDYYKNPQFENFSEMMSAIDRLDSAQLTIDDVTKPEGWILLGLTLDPRSGLGPEFQKYFRWLVEYVKELPLAKVLQHPEVKKRCDRVLHEQEEFKAVLQQHSRSEQGVIITDFRGQKNLPVGNRFLVYTMYPECHVEVRLFDGLGGKVVLAAGRSIFCRKCQVSCGELLARYGGGGHAGAGTCQLEGAEAPAKIAEIVSILQKNQAAG